MLRRELDISVALEEFWTDRQVVLGSISNEAQRFKTFAANRVQLGESQRFNNGIMYHLRVTLQITHLEKVHRWFSDPSFLWSKDRDWLKL